MPRRAIFLALMVMLGATLAYLIYQSSQREAEAPERPVEIVKTFRSTPTRVPTPPDLRVVESRIERPGNGDGEAGPNAVHRLVIRNSGPTSYRNAMLRLVYRDRAGAVLETRTHLVSGGFPAGETVTVPDIGQENVPAATRRCDVTILYTELDAPGDEEKPDSPSPGPPAEGKDR